MRTKIRPHTGFRAGLRQLRFAGTFIRRPWLSQAFTHAGPVRDTHAVHLAHEVAPLRPDLGPVFDRGEVLIGTDEFRRLP